MSENKEKTTEEIQKDILAKKAEKLEKATKVVVKAKEAAAAAKKALDEAAIAFKAAEKPEEKKATEKTLSEAKEALKVAVKAVSVAKIKGSQEGDYLPAKEKERALFHVELDKPSYSKTDGRKLSKAYMQKFTIAEWKHFVKNASGLGFTADIKWDPTVYVL